LPCSGRPWGEMEKKINDSTLQLRLNLPKEKVLCQLDGTRTYRVFENILSNILKYSLPQTRVYIDVKEETEKVSITFKNISAYEMNFDPQEIVERFTRGDKSRSTEGSGLGLAIAKSLVELQRGSLEINIDGDLFKLTVTFPTAGHEESRERCPN
jgi:signal transduction histidine kinase